MSQHDMNLADQTRSSFRADLNNALLALVGLSSGATEPATMWAYMLWADTTSGYLKQRNAANTAWLIKGKLASDMLAAWQKQEFTAFTTGGTSTAFTLTPVPASAANVTGTRFRVTFNAAAGTTPTLAVSGLAAAYLKYKDSTGAKQAITSAQVPSGWIADVEFDGTDWVVLDVPSALGAGSSTQVFSSAAAAAAANVLRADQVKGSIAGVTGTVAASALTATLNPCVLDFRSTTLTTGVPNTRFVPSDISLVVPSGATLGTVNGVQSDLVLLAIDNAGTIELAIVNIAGGVNLDETTLISTTALGTGSDSANVIYSTTGRTSVPFRVVGLVRSTQATAGTWATTPSLVQGMGGSALAAMGSIGYGQTWQDVTRTSGVQYTNTTGRTIMFMYYMYGSGGVTTALLYLNGEGTPRAYISCSSGSDGATMCVPIPPGGTYQLNVAGGALSGSLASELR